MFVTFYLETTRNDVKLEEFDRVVKKLASS